MRSALEGLQFVDKHQPIDVNISTRYATFTVTDRKRFSADQVKKALTKAGFPDARVIKAPG